MVEEAVEQHVGEDLASSREKGDTTMIVAGMLVSFALVDVAIVASLNSSINTKKC